MCVSKGFYLFFKFHQSREYLEKTFGLWPFFWREKTDLFSLSTSSIHLRLFFPFVSFYFLSRPVTEKVEVVLVNHMELIFVSTSASCDVRGVNVKAWDDDRFQMLPTRIMCLGVWVRRHGTAALFFFSPFYGLKEQIMISLADPPVFLYWKVPCWDKIDYDIVWLNKGFCVKIII